MTVNWKKKTPERWERNRQYTEKCKITNLLADNL